MAEKTICILGGGISGIITARELRRYLGVHHRIIVIDRNDEYHFPPSFLWIMLGWRKPEVIRKPLSILGKHGIEFHHSTIRKIDTTNSIIETDLAKLRYDYCVISLGAESIPAPDPAIEERFQTPAEVLRLRDAVNRFKGGTVAIVVRGIPHVWPPAPYEAAFLLQAWWQQRGVDRVSIRIFTPEEEPLGFAGHAASEALRGLLGQNGILLHTNCRVSGIRADVRHIEFDGKPSEPFDLLIGIPDSRPPEVLRNSGIAGPDGWIPVDERTLRTERPEIFVTGDSARIATHPGFLLPNTSVFAFTQAEVVSHRIAHSIRNEPATKDFTGNSFLFIETGNGRACMLHGNFLSKSEPALILNQPSVASHWGKVVAEKYWLWRWF